MGAKVRQFLCGSKDERHDTYRCEECLRRVRNRPAPPPAPPPKIVRQIRVEGVALNGSTMGVCGPAIVITETER